jgi:galactokinase
LENSTYRVRRQECEELVETLRPEFGISCLADVRRDDVYQSILEQYGRSHPDHCRRLAYIFRAQRRFSTMIEAWKAGDMATVGRVFREDGIGLRDEYQIYGPELETMCDIARTVPGVLGERMLGGGDKGAAGALVRASSVEALATAVRTGYPRSHPSYAGRYAMHVCQVVKGVATLEERI